MVPHGWTHNPCMADTGHTLVFIDTIEAKQTKEQSKDRCNRRLRDSRPKKAKEQQSKGFFAPFLAPSPFWLARCLSLALCIYIYTYYTLVTFAFVNDRFLQSQCIVHTPCSAVVSPTVPNNVAPCSPLCSGGADFLSVGLCAMDQWGLCGWHWIVRDQYIHAQISRSSIF